MQKRVRVDDNWVLARGQKVHGPRWFRVEEYLGRGAFAAAYRVTDADGGEFFLKEYLPPEHSEQLSERAAMYRQERRILMRVSGMELCPALHAAFSDSGFDYLVQDFVRGRDMETVLASDEVRREGRILRWAVCLTRAVAYLHAQKIVHQDLKPANIRLNENDDPVLIDFGAARDFSLEGSDPADGTIGGSELTQRRKGREGNAKENNERMSPSETGEPDPLCGTIAESLRPLRLCVSPEASSCSSGKAEALAEYGTDGYMPPERALGEERGLAAGRRADVFALGAVLVEAMIGQRLSQEEINAHKEKLFGALIHSATLPSEFVHAVFRALSYDPGQRYPSAEAMLEDLLSIAPPVGRVDRRFLDFGRAEPGVPVRRLVTVYNAGGGLLHGQVEVDADWLQVAGPSGHGAAGRGFESNRQQFGVTALPERLPPRGGPAEAEVRFVFPSGIVRVRCAIDCPPQPAEVRVTPSHLQVWPGPRGRASGTLAYRNSGELPATISLQANPAGGIRLEPAEFRLEAGTPQVVTIHWDSAAGRPEHLLEWHVDGCSGGFIPLEVVTVRSLARAVASRFRRAPRDRRAALPSQGSEYEYSALEPAARGSD